MTIEELKNRENFIEEDFIKLRALLEKTIKIFEKYRYMRKDSNGYIRELKRFLGEVDLILEDKAITNEELINLNNLKETYFNFHGNSLSEYGVYDKNDLEKTNTANREITVSINELGEILYRITEKVIYHII